MSPNTTKSLPGSNGAPGAESGGGPRWLLVGVALAAVLAAAVIFFLQGGFDQSASTDTAETESLSPEELTPVPTASFEMFDGSTATLADYRGRPLVVNFWASWCPPCVAEMPLFEKAHQELQGKMAFLGVNFNDSESAAAETVEITGVTYDLARDPDGALFNAFGVFGMPSSFFVDPEGMVVIRWTGALNERALQDQIDRLLEVSS